MALAWQENAQLLEGNALGNGTAFDLLTYHT
jgi:hypothetical protein